MFKLLSYPINATSPGWPENPKVSFEALSAISNGANANTYNILLFNHFGSHMDGPKHFNDKGPNLHQMPLETFIYERPLLLDIPKTFGELILAEDLQPFADRLKAADLLMIRSGFSAERERSAKRYSEEGVGFSSESCKYLIENFPNLKAVAMDWISLASFAHGEEGVLAHQYLLGKFHNDRYICIIEDLNFADLSADRLRRVFSLPLMVEGIDSAPVTVLAELTDSSS